MTSLICLVQRLTLAAPERKLVKEHEVFEVDEATAATYIKGGIAKVAPASVLPPKPPAEVYAEAPAHRVEPVEEPTPIEEESPPAEEPAVPEVTHIGRKAKRRMA